MSNSKDPWAEVERRAALSGTQGMTSNSDDLISDDELGEAAINPNSKGGKSAGGAGGGMPPMMMGGGRGGGAQGAAPVGGVGGDPSAMGGAQAMGAAGVARGVAPSAMGSAGGLSANGMPAGGLGASGGLGAGGIGGGMPSGMGVGGMGGGVMAAGSSPGDVNGDGIADRYVDGGIDTDGDGIADTGFGVSDSGAGGLDGAVGGQGGSWGGAPGVSGPGYDELPSSGGWTDSGSRPNPSGIGDHGIPGRDVGNAGTIPGGRPTPGDNSSVAPGGPKNVDDGPVGPDGSIRGPGPTDPGRGPGAGDLGTTDPGKGPGIGDPGKIDPGRGPGTGDTGPGVRGVPGDGNGRTSGDGSAEVRSTDPSAMRDIASRWSILSAEMQSLSAASKRESDFGLVKKVEPSHNELSGAASQWSAGASSEFESMQGKLGNAAGAYESNEDAARREAEKING